MDVIMNFEALIDSQLIYLKQLARNYTSSEMAADDLFQDTVVRIWSNQDKFEMGTNFKAWSSMIMRNLFINDYRKQKKRRNDSAYYDEEKIESHIENSGEQKMIYDDLLNEIHTLATNYSKPLELFYEGFSYREIAEDMGISIGTVKSRMHSARGYLKQRLAS
ncbi:RNA polymerase sigma factor [Flavilitoribacter nigricans]|uniref:Sigma-70 family RNA polymerase sigma factor n=1 Tax=Flavilitoribacter nigricans (strain ATCC 23147 / DSM 23189 / NBRC 102662 / NCIMB 1420 / SS-2) TaxID=1122177 RepID=A0A2D0N494_FLAN2|nr:RNA polymerase sigma factor [Flavilitoribacter nigricans]PHN03341.1 hypothetical protein CRP01_27030 [Flavilitoribacter nigricans DSM 23189 = NBRC 102662]